MPSLAQYFLTPSERDMKKNAMILRGLIEEIIEKRKQMIKNKDPRVEEMNDFLTILLKSNHF